VTRPKLELADIFRAHGPAWRQAHAGHVSLTQLKVVSAIEACRWVRWCPKEKDDCCMSFLSAAAYWFGSRHGWNPATVGSCPGSQI